MADRVRRGRVVLPTDAHTEALYLAVIDHLESLGFPQYEVANFARPGAESKHNRNYWRGRPWLGLGHDVVALSGSKQCGRQAGSQQSHLVAGLRLFD